MKYLPFLDTFVTLASSCTYECCCYCSTLHSCPAVCYPMDYSMPGFPVLHHLLELAQIHVHWAGDAIQPSHTLSRHLLLPSIFPRIRDFSNESGFFASGGQIIGGSASASAFPMNIQDWFPLGLAYFISLQFKELSRVFSNTTFQKH